MRRLLRKLVRLLRKNKLFRKTQYSHFVFGLGNPGEEYEDTLHNAGFHVLDAIAEREGVFFKRIKGNALTADFAMGEKRILLAKPLTYMNASGHAVDHYRRKMGLTEENFIVVYDDMDIEPGRIKIKKGGGHGGHRGLMSVILETGMRDFVRVRVGIGKPPRGVTATDYVLSPPPPEISEKIKRGIFHAADAIMMLLADGLEKTMSYYNSSLPYEAE
ncbi:MAG: aminoacyl-tRNA hydrolase [Deltaproteobacteria bacterium]|nr:MAG: aminoacyl-tRNA hydrolase [Deltaproteobacteria bacterium]